jgi:hypothetical protein
MSDQRHRHSNLSSFRAVVPPGTVEPGFVELLARRHHRPRPHYWDNTLVPVDDRAVSEWRSPRTAGERPRSVSNLPYWAAASATHRRQFSIDQRLTVEAIPELGNYPFDVRQHDVVCRRQAGARRARYERRASPIKEKRQKSARGRVCCSPGRSAARAHG